MKKITTLLALLPTVLIGQSLVTQTPQNRSALLEDFTGIHCGYCPEGHTIMASLEAMHGTKIAVVGIHAGSFAVPGAGEPDFRTPEGTAIDAYFTIGGYPAGVINRHVFDGEDDLGRGAWEGAVAEMLALPSPVNLGVESSYDAGTNELTVNVELYYTADSPPGDDYISVLVKEDHLDGPQTDYGPSGNHANYDHVHVLRGYVTDTWGDMVVNPTMGSTITRSYTMTVPAAWNIANCRVVAFVSEDHSEVYQGSDIAADGGTTLVIGEFADSAPVYVGVPNGTPAAVNTVFTNLLGSTEDYIVTLTSMGAPAGWSSELQVNGAAVTSPATAQVSAGDDLNMDVSIMPDATPGVASYLLSVASSSNPAAPVLERVMNVISGVTDLVVTHNGAEQWEPLYTDGLAQAGNTAYAAVTKDKFLNFASEGALAGVNNYYVNVSWTFPSLTDDEVVALSALMDAGSDVMIAGQDIGWDQSGVTGAYGTAATQAFYSDYMHATYVADGSTAQNLVNFIDGDFVFGDVPNSSIAAVFGTNTYPDQITPIAPAVGIIHYNTNTNLIGGLRCETGNYKVVYFGVGPEQMSNADVAHSMVSLSHDWFYGVVSVEEFDALLASTLGQAYPVPANDQITIPFSDLRTNATLEVYDVTGRSVMQKNIANGTTQVTLDVAGLGAGLYRYALRTAEGLGAAKAFQVVK
ncbi:MAG: Omp28-related outer membrane protein [Flavobacteriales bacterium]|nr:Omp28-related outer membrane protein [Flavobacteriales bacterium]